MFHSSHASMPRCPFCAIGHYIKGLFIPQPKPLIVPSTGETVEDYVHKATKPYLDAIVALKGHIAQLETTVSDLVDKRNKQAREELLASNRAAQRAIDTSLTDLLDIDDMGNVTLRPAFPRTAEEARIRLADPKFLKTASPLVVARAWLMANPRPKCDTEGFSITANKELDSLSKALAEHQKQWHALEKSHRQIMRRFLEAVARTSDSLSADSPPAAPERARSAASATGDPSQKSQEPQPSPQAGRSSLEAHDPSSTAGHAEGRHRPNVINTTAAMSQVLPNDRIPTLAETAAKPDALTSVVERIKAENIRINQALIEPDTTDDRYRELYAAQQALGWALDPSTARSPYETIMADKCGRVA